MTTLTLTLVSEPFRSDPPDAERYSTAIGRALMLWGRFEMHLETLLLVCRNLPDAREFTPEQMPISLKGKATLLRRLFRDVPAFSKVQGLLTGVISDAMSAVQDRHTIVHGHYNGFVRSDPLTARFLHREQGGWEVTRTRCDVDLSTLEEMAGKFDSLNTRLLAVTAFVVGLYPRPTAGSAEAG